MNYKHTQDYYENLLDGYVRQKGKSNVIQHLRNYFGDYRINKYGVINNRLFKVIEFLQKENVTAAEVHEAMEIY